MPLQVVNSRQTLSSGHPAGWLYIVYNPSNVPISISVTLVCANAKAP